MGDHPLAEQAARLGQRLADRFRDLVDVKPRPARHRGGVAPVGVDQLRHLDPVGDPEREILLAVARRDMDETGALVGGDEIAVEQRHVVLVAAAAERVRRHVAGELPRPGSPARPSQPAMPVSSANRRTRSRATSSRSPSRTSAPSPVRSTRSSA